MTWADPARSAAMVDMAMAWAWCGIMPWANVISAWLWAWATCAELAELLVGGVAVVPQPPSAAPAVRAAAAAATKVMIVRVDMSMFLCV